MSQSWTSCDECLSRDDVRPVDDGRYLCATCRRAIELTAD